MRVDGTTLTFDSTLWVQHGAVELAERGGQVAVTGRDEDSYLKVLNHFGRVLKLYLFEGGAWIDAETGLAPQPFDESQAGRLPAIVGEPGPAPTRKPTGVRPAVRKPAGHKPAAKPADRSAAPRKKAAKPAARSSAPRKKAAKPRASRGSG